MIREKELYRVTWQLLTISQTTNFRQKMKEFADDNLKFDENGRKFYKRVENTVGKGEIARYEQFLLFPQCFQKTSKNQGLFGKVLRVIVNYTFRSFIIVTHLIPAMLTFDPRVPRGSVVRCLTRNPGVLGSSLTRSSGFFRGSVLGQDTSEPSLVLVKPRKAPVM